MVFLEPVSFYQDPVSYAYRLQKEILASFEKIQETLQDQGSSDNYVLVERSWESSIHVFSELLKRSGYLKISEFEKLCQYASLLQKPSGIVSLKSDPEKCFDRIQGRSLPGDEKITVNYLQELDQQYEKYISSKIEIPVLHPQ